MKLRFLLPALAVSFAAAFSACRTTVNTVQSANPRARITPEQMKHIKTDSSLEDAATPVSLITGKAADGESLKVQLEVQNTTRTTAYLNYRVDWKDAQGLALSGYTATTHQLAIEGGEIKAIAVTAPSPRAVDFQFTFIERKGD